MAQFAGKGGAGWAWVLVVLLVVIAVIVAYLAIFNPGWLQWDGNTLMIR